MNRRDFLYKSGVAVASSFFIPSLLHGCTSQTSVTKDVGLQLYTIREALSEDFAGSLKKVAALGYKNLELFNYNDGKYFGNSIKEVKNMVSDLGMKIRSSHVGTGQHNPDYVGTPTNGWEKAVEDAAMLEQEYIVVAYLQKSERTSIDDYKKVVDLLNKAGETAKKAGIKLAYHNHDFEFEPFDGEMPYDMMLAQCDKNLVQFEMDLYWMKYANQDPLTYFEQHSGRFPLWHVKDMSADEDKFFSSVGDGIINWQRLFEKAEASGLKYYFVEQDRTRNNKPFEEIEQSIAYIKGSIH